jgi:hypothetical protein
MSINLIFYFTIGCSESSYNEDIPVTLESYMTSY